ncbi:MAG TPA: hypothetical protein VN624_11255 [Rhodanobacter sp.]|nr:hypothetical protein [Rhodanobacter sp.]
MSTYGPLELSQRVQALMQGLTEALQRGLKMGATAVNDAARANLSGTRADPPWSYPVPRRRGNLFRHQKIQVVDIHTAYVFNDAEYAAAIHNGYVSEWAGRGKHRMRMKGSPRPFLDDAAESAQPLMVIQREVEGELQAWQ